MLEQIVRLADGALQARTPEEASSRFFEAARRLGATYLQTRLYRRPMTLLTSETHWAAGGFIKRVARDGWVGSAAFKYICFECNPLLAAIRENLTSYRFSDFAPFGQRRFRPYWEALTEADMAEALCATSYGTKGVITSLHLGFGERDLNVKTIRAVQMAGVLLTERLLEFAGGLKDDTPELTARERDCLAFMADGRRDREIGDRLGITEQTVRFHVDNARRKLGAANRAQAIARLANRRLI